MDDNTILSILLLDEPTAKEGILKPLDLMFRDQEIRPNYNVAHIPSRITRNFPDDSRFKN